MSLTEFSVRRPIATWMAVLAFCVGGLLAMFALSVDKLPASESSTVTIFVGVRGGMPPEDIENLVTIPVEEAVATLPGLKEMVSVAKKDKTNITLVFDGDQDVKRATLDVSERLARIRGKLPKEIEKPIVARYNENDHPIVILSATSSVKSPEVIRTMIERDLKPLLSRVSGVANVDISGGRQRKILVEFDKAKLEMHRISILDVIRDLGESNVSMMSGTFESERDALGVQITSQFKTLDDMRELGIAVTKEGSRIRLKDVAVVRDYYLEPDSYARVNNQPSVSVYVQKESGANTITAAAGVMKVIRTYEKTLPDDMGIGISIDQSVAIRQAIGGIREALTFGAFITAFVLWLFLRRTRQVAVIVLSIPISVLGTFFAMMLQSTLARKFGGMPPITINLMSLLGIALAIGRMVDDSIVVFDNIVFRYRQARRNFGLRVADCGFEEKKDTEAGIPQPVSPAPAGKPVGGTAAQNPQSAIRNPRLDKVAIAVAATKEVAIPVASSTVIMFVIFLPIVFVSDEIRRIYADVAYTFIAALIFSLTLAVTLVPMLAVRTLRDEDGDEAGAQYGWERKIERGLRNFISRIRGRDGIRKAEASPDAPGAARRLRRFFRVHIGEPLLELVAPLARPFRAGSLTALVRRCTAWTIRKRAWVMAGVLFSAGLSVYLYVSVLEKEYIGEKEKKEFVIFVELPSGTKLDVSDKVVAAVENEINSMPEVKEVVKTVSARVEGWSSKIYVTLGPEAQRTRTVQDVIDALRPRLTDIGAQYEAFIYFSEPSRSKEVIVDTFGKDYLTLREVAIAIAKRLQEVPDLRDVKLRYKPGRPEVRLNVDHARAAAFGLTSKDIADALHAQIRGLRATYFNAGNEQVETVGRLSEEDRRTWDKVANLSLISKTKTESIVPIMQVIDHQNAITPSEVWRRDKERVIQVSANRQRLALSTAIEKAKAALKGLEVPVGYYYEFGGDYEKLVASEKEFIYAFIIMLLLVYMVLACFFESYTQPFIMLLTIPLATAGAMPALWATDTAVNLGAYLGFLMLGGTVVSNAVILIDRLNMVRSSRSLLRAAVKVSNERARPIMMTSLTTNAAMIPLISSRGESADIWIPLGLVVVSGILISSILTLFVIPAAYVILELAIENWKAWVRGRKSGREAVKGFLFPRFLPMR